jgi:hypothetical protein
MRKDRLTELQVQLTHERFLRDEAMRRTAMLEVEYGLRRFSDACVEAQGHHEHNQTIISQKDLPVIVKLVRLAQTAMDVLDKNASLVDGRVRDQLEAARDNWIDMYRYEDHPHALRGALIGGNCCSLGDDLEILEVSVNEGVFALERQLDSMRFN